MIRSRLSDFLVCMLAERGLETVDVVDAQVIVVEIEAELGSQCEVDARLGKRIPEGADEREFRLVKVIPILRQGALEIIPGGRPEGSVGHRLFGKSLEQRKTNLQVRHDAPFGHRSAQIYGQARGADQPSFREV